MTQNSEMHWDPSLPPFLGPGSELPDAGYAIEAMADGTNFSNPESLLEVVKSLLTDGSLAVLEGWDNREVVIRLRIGAPAATPGPALAEAEKALMLAVQATPKAPLVWVPPAQDAATCVFDVVAAKLERDTTDGWDMHEVQRSYRYYTLTLTCLPFARTEDSVVVPALAPPPASPTSVTIDDGTSTVNWTATTDSTGSTSVSVSSGLVTTSASGWTSAGTKQEIVKRTAAIAMGTVTKYLRVRMRFGYTGNGVTSSSPSPGFYIWLGSTATYTEPIATAAVPGGGGLRDYYFLPPENFDAFSFVHSATSASAGSFNLFSGVDEIARTDTIPGAGTTRQQARLATVAGSAPTQAAVRLFNPSLTLLGSDILVHTSSNTDWIPALRPFRLVGSGDSVTADTTLVSGARNTLDLATRFIIPANLLTEGTYSLMARLNVSATSTLNWRANIVDSTGANVIGSTVTTSGSISLASTSGSYKVINLAALSLPPVRTEGTQYIEVRLWGAPNATLDEAWLFGLHDGALTWVQDGGDNMAWVEIRSPELTATRPSVYGGYGVPGSSSTTCIDWKCQSFGAHRFEPGQIQIFTVTTTATNAQSELEFYPRYHTHVEGTAA